MNWQSLEEEMHLDNRATNSGGERADQLSLDPFLDLSNRYYLITYSDGRLVYGNRLFLRDFKLESKNIAKYNFLDVFHAQDKTMVLRKLMLAVKIRQFGQYRILEGDSGGVITCNVVMSSHQGKVYLEIEKKGVTTEISDKDNDEVKLEDIIDQLSVAAVLFDKNLTFIKGNAALLALTGYSNAELENIKILQTVHPDFLKDCLKGKEDLLEGKKEFLSMELPVKHRDKSFLWVKVYISVVKGAPEGKVQYVAFVLDINTLKSNEIELLQNFEELNVLIDTVSHDLKGPLRSLLALHDVVKLEFKGDEKVMEYFKHYNNSIRKLSNTTQDLLSLSKVRSLESVSKSVDVARMVDECLQLFSHFPNFSKINFQLDIQLEGMIEVEERLLNTIIQNLLENAIKYSDDLNPEVQIWIGFRKHFFIIEVKDNGIGIEPSLQSKIFEMFFRATNKSSGSGLGLYILHKAVTKLSGSVKVKSEPGKGTCFTVMLPYIKSSAL